MAYVSVGIDVNNQGEIVEHPGCTAPMTYDQQFECADESSMVTDFFTGAATGGASKLPWVLIGGAVVIYALL